MVTAFLFLLDVRISSAFTLQERINSLNIKKFIELFSNVLGSGDTRVNKTVPPLEA